ncbi:MAG: hypothetical protein JRH11_22555 [Deltaproteobacteria bacterium]|nr:hypothetical protein [Deltaproteobacteria bacterium]
MPVSTLICLAFVSGFAAALAGRAELRVSPRPPVLSRSFFAWLSFALFVLVPVSLYFYAFYGDWFLLYTVDMRRIPSALAMVGFGVEVLVGVAGFAFAGLLIRGQRDGLAGGLLALSILAGMAAIPAAGDRLSSVGSFAQYKGGFGLVPYGSGSLMTGTLAMGAILALCLAILLGSLWVGSRRC